MKNIKVKCIFGIVTLIWVITSCGLKITDPQRNKFRFWYINKSKNDINLYFVVQRKKFIIKDGDSLSIFELVGSQTTPSLKQAIKIEFVEEKKCLNLNNSTIISLNDIKNYEKIIDNQISSQTYRYKIDTKDLALAKACE